MKKIFVLIVCLYGMWAYAAVAEEGDYDLGEAKQLMSQVDVFDKIGKEAFQDIENKILSMNPQLVEQNADKSNNEKLVVYRSYLARASFDWYKEYFINKLKERSRQTGRQIKPKVPEADDKGDIYYLDNGRLDLPECQQDGWQICPYPDKHEEFYVVIQDSETLGEIFVMEDDVARNINQSFDITLVNNTSTDMSRVISDISLNINYQQSSYDEWADYREKERAYTAKFKTMSKKELRNYRRKVEQGKITEDGNSNVLPAAVVIGQFFNFEASLSKTNENQ